MKAMRASIAMLTSSTTQRREMQQIMSLVDASVDRVRNIAYKEVTIVEASDIYATGGILYISIRPSMDAGIVPLRFSKNIVNNIWKIDLSFYKLVDFILESHFEWNGNCYFFVEIPLSKPH